MKRIVYQKSRTGIFLLFIMIGFIACKKEEFKTSTTSDVNISDYLSQRPEQFSEFSKILQLTENEGFLAAYGTYTLFAPNNAAIAAFLTSKGKASVNDVAIADLKDMVKMHLVRDTIASVLFNDGKLRTRTMYGQYLITGAQNINGSTFITINRQANVKQADIRVGNGIIHVVDNVLSPAKLTLAEMISQNDDFSIFEEALRETGLYDSLNVLPGTKPDTAYHTVLVESNDVLRAMDPKITSFAALKEKYSDTGNPKLTSDSLYLFMAYHILPGLKYIPDIFKASSHTTLSPLDVVTAKLKGTTLLINDDTFNGIHEQGAAINRPASDLTAANGVLHVMSNPYAIKVRFPIPVYWEVTDQPEFTSLNGIFRVSNKSSKKFNPGELQDINWEQGSAQYIVAPEARKFYVYNDDYLQFGSLRTNVVANSWIEFKTPLLVKGRYKVWICFIRRGGGGGVAVSFNGELLPKVLNLRESLPAGVLVGNKWTYPPGTTPESLEILGKKMVFSEYVYQPNPSQTIDYYRDSYGLLAGTIDVKKTDRHILRMDATWEGSGDVQFDMIHFIPEKEDQLWPKFNPDGTVVQKP